MRFPSEMPEKIPAGSDIIMVAETELSDPSKYKIDNLAIYLTEERPSVTFSGEYLTIDETFSAIENEINNTNNAKFNKSDVVNTKSTSTTQVYSSNYINDNFAPRTLIENLYLNKTTATTASLLPTKPTLLASNYLTLNTSNTTMDFSGSQKYVLERVLTTKVTFDSNSALIVSLNLAFSRNTVVTFGIKLFINGLQVNNNYTSGQEEYSGSTSYTDVYEKKLTIPFDALLTPTEYQVGSIIKVEVFTKQSSATSLTTRIYAGANQGDGDRYSYIQYNFSALGVDTQQITDGAVTIPKLSNDVIALFGTKADITPANGSTSALRALYIAAGAVYNSTTGYYEMNGLTDLTENEMCLMYSYPLSADNLSGTWGYPYRTNFPILGRGGYGMSASVATSIKASLSIFRWTQYTKVIRLILDTTDANHRSVIIDGSSVNMFDGATSPVSQLEEVIDILILSNVTNLNNSFRRQPNLKRVRLFLLKANVSFAESPILETEYATYMVANASSTTAFSITFHADVYDRIIADTAFTAALATRPLISILRA